MTPLTLVKWIALAIIAVGIIIIGYAGPNNKEGIGWIGILISFAGLVVGWTGEICL